MYNIYNMYVLPARARVCCGRAVVDVVVSVVHRLSGVAAAAGRRPGRTDAGAGPGHRAPANTVNCRADVVIRRCWLRWRRRRPCRPADWWWDRRWTRRRRSRCRCLCDRERER